MKSSRQWFLHSLGMFCLLAAGALRATGAASAADMGQGFATPEAAVQALLTAASAADTNAFRAIFGPVWSEIMNPDRVQAANELRVFNAAAQQRQRIVTETAGRRVLEVGENAWPFPIPLVQREGRWFFDTAAGKEELLNRRIGRNELATLQVVRAYVDAQREYASKDRDGDQVLEYAQHFLSSPGKKDGLYWPADLDGEVSPLGPLVAGAQARGYRRSSPDPDHQPEPYQGYLFKILTRQGKHAPGGAYRDIINGNMIAGFALVAWPAEYGESGIMTFIVNQQGRVHQKDLGPKTGERAAAMQVYDPDPAWQLSPD